MLDFNEELAKFQPCADLEEAEENIYGKELEAVSYTHLSNDRRTFRIHRRGTRDQCTGSVSA